jgi:hypothetical protein
MNNLKMLEMALNALKQCTSNEWVDDNKGKRYKIDDVLAKISSSRIETYSEQIQNELEPLDAKSKLHDKTGIPAGMKIVPHYEVKLYIGSNTFFSDDVFTQEDIEKFVGEVQDDYDYIIPLRITPTTFVAGSDYKESGLEVTAINYPKISTTEDKIKLFMLHLANALLIKFNQHTICVMDGETTTMLKGLKY